MSRSRRKNPYVTEQQWSSDIKLRKRWATRSVRQLPKNEAPTNGSNYKRYFNSWHICDYKFYSPDYKKGKRK